MPQDVITYLKKSNGNIRLVVPELEIINDSYRFDAGRFDLLACCYRESKIYGIKELCRNPGFEGLQKIVEDAGWVKKYKGAVIILMPAGDKTLHNLLDKEEHLGLIVKKYYADDGKGYMFMDCPKDYERMGIERFQGDAVRLFSSPQIIDFVLKRFEKELPAIKFARELYKAYLKAQK